MDLEVWMIDFVPWRLSWRPLTASFKTMSLPFYHYLHLIGLILIFVGYGGLLSAERAKTAMMWHGIGLVISLVSGFGMAAKYAKMLPEGAPSYYMQPWVLIKIVLWLVLGFLPLLAKKKILTGSSVVKLAILFGAALAYLGYFKPVI
jgi:hypothetical protein